MPNKTIYIRDEDVEVFEKVAELGDGPLSQVLAKALREYLARKESMSKGIELVTLRVGYHGGRTVRFTGRLLGQWPDGVTSVPSGWLGDVPPDEWGEEEEALRVYESAKGRILVYRVYPPHEVYEYQVYESFKDFSEKSGIGPPHPLFENVAEQLGEEGAEYLDI